MLKNFNEMEEKDILDTLKLIKEKYNVDYEKVGYSKEGMNNTIAIVVKNNGSNLTDILNIIFGVFMGMTDIDGNDIEGNLDYDDISCPSVYTFDTSYPDGLKAWINRTERGGKIVWLKCQ